MTASYEEPTLRVTLGEIYREVRELRDTVRPMACDLAALRQTSAENFRDLDTRVDGLEADRFPWVKIGAMVGVIGLIAAIVFGILSQTSNGPPGPPPPAPTAGP